MILDRPVAVKVLRPKYASQPQALARFRAEARHAGKLDHPAIARIYDYGESEEEPAFLVMELVDGPSLAEMIARGPLRQARTMDVLAQVADGLQAAHAAGLVHRDIKPGNLLIGPAHQVKITDFGIAGTAGSEPVTLTGTVLGTLAYLAPERAAGGPTVPASDLYSLGIVGYECLTGVPPFRGTSAEVVAAHRHRPIPPLPRSVPPGVTRLLAELTAKDPAGRPASARAVAVRAGRLRSSLTHGTATGQPAQRPARRRPVPVPPIVMNARRAPRRGPGTLLAAACAVAGIVGWLVPAGFPPAPAGPRSSASPASTPAIRAVSVPAAALIGQPVSDVVRTLLNLGLRPHVTWVTGRRAGGTVISVSPGGSVPRGSTVTVKAAGPLAESDEPEAAGNVGE